MASSSPSSEVCNRLVFEAFTENSVSKLKLAIRTYSQTELLTSLAQRNEECETPLVVAMKMKNGSIINKFVTWMSKRYVYKNKESMVMIILNQLARNHIPIMTMIDYLIKDLVDEVWLEFIGQVFIESSSFIQQDRIIALELIGAYTIMSGSSYLKEFSALNYWRQAMIFRYSSADGGPLFPKVPALHVPSAASCVIFGSAVEVMTMDELKLLQEDWEHNATSRNFVVRPQFVKRLEIQALLVIRRISSQADLEHPHWLYLESLHRFGEFMMYNQQNKIAINTWLLILEQMNGFDPKMLSRKKYDVLIEILCLLITCFSEVLQAPPDSQEREELSYANLLAPIKFITTIQFDHFDDNDRLRFLDIVVDFLFFMHSISPQMTNEEKKKLEEYFSNFIRNSFPQRTPTVLHAAVRSISHGWFDLNSLDTIKLILKLGADPNAIDEKGQTPLHILAGTWRRSDLEEYLPVFQALVDAGSHLDFTADDGETVLSILKKTFWPCKINSFIVHPYFDSQMNTIFPLSCYAARVIRRNGIRFDEDRLPLHLQEFVARHSPNELND